MKVSMAQLKIVLVGVRRHAHIAALAAGEWSAVLWRTAPADTRSWQLRTSGFRRSEGRLRSRPHSH